MPDYIICRKGAKNCMAIECISYAVQYYTIFHKRKVPFCALQMNSNQSLDRQIFST